MPASESWQGSCGAQAVTLRLEQWEAASVAAPLLPTPHYWEGENLEAGLTTSESGYALLLP